MHINYYNRVNSAYQFESDYSIDSCVLITCKSAASPGGSFNNSPAKLRPASSGGGEAPPPVLSPARADPPTALSSKPVPERLAPPVILTPGTSAPRKPSPAVLLAKRPVPPPALERLAPPVVLAPGASAQRYLRCGGTVAKERVGVRVNCVSEEEGIGRLSGAGLKVPCAPK